MKANVILKLMFHECNGTMDCDIRSGDDILYSLTNNNPGLQVINMSIDWPSTLYIETFGKGNRDTKLANDGSIEADKRITIENIIVDGIAVSPEHIFMHKIVEFNHDSSQEFTNYLGFNGIAKINFSGPKPIYWLLKNTG